MTGHGQLHEERKLLTSVLSALGAFMASLNQWSEVHKTRDYSGNPLWNYVMLLATFVFIAVLSRLSTQIKSGNNLKVDFANHVIHAVMNPFVVS